eukprot:SAG31_NODE_4606_length_3098_cov_8.299100_3_plen_76_part_00
MPSIKSVHAKVEKKRALDRTSAWLIGWKMCKIYSSITLVLGRATVLHAPAPPPLYDSHLVHADVVAILDQRYNMR